MSKTYTSLLVVLLAGAQTIRAQDNLDDVFAQLDAAEADQTAVAPDAAPAPAAVQSAPAPAAPAPAAVQPAPAPAAPAPAAVQPAPAPAAPAPAAVQSVQPATVENSAIVPVTEKPVEMDLYSRGVQYYRAGEYAKAEAVFEAVLAKDPYNRRAMEKLKRTAYKISSNEAVLKNATRAQRMAAIEGAWNPELKEIAVPQDDTGGATKTADQLAIEAMTARLQGIMIPSLDFRDANIKDVVLFLTETCRRQDPSKQGVNILLMGMNDPEAAGQNNITISIRDMSLYEALQYIVEMASLKFDVQTKAVAIMPVGYVPPGELVLISYDVIPEVGEELESMTGGGGGVDDLFGDTSADSGSEGPADVQGFFSIVEWPEGSSAVYQPNFHKLFVKNTKTNLKAVEDILADLEDEAIAKRSQQVQIEAKFVEYNEGALEELGFDWTMYDNGEFAGFGLDTQGDYYRRGQGYAGTANVNRPLNGSTGSALYHSPITGYEEINGKPGQTLFGSGQRNNSTAFETLQSGVLSTMGGAPAQMMFNNRGAFPLDLAITALEQEGTADVLSAPMVTTKSGNEAVIRVVEVHRYPQDYDVETGQRTAPVVKPQDWEDYDLGVVLKVTPVVDSESNTIDLDLQPEITKLKGWDQYIVGYNSYESGEGNSSTLLGNSAALVAQMPFFETRTIQTQVTISDGNTVVMGGLVDERTETFRDQVPFLGDLPFLGRLFRTEGSRTAKKNLVISVKATQVDDKGLSRAEREMARQTAAK